VCAYLALGHGTLTESSCEGRPPPSARMGEPGEKDSTAVGGEDAPVPVAATLAGERMGRGEERRTVAMNADVDTYEEDEEEEEEEEEET
jgi:hypothetical protein